LQVKYRAKVQVTDFQKKKTGTEPKLPYHLMHCYSVAGNTVLSVTGQKPSFNAAAANWSNTSYRSRTPDTRQNQKD